MILDRRSLLYGAAALVLAAAAGFAAARLTAQSPPPAAPPAAAVAGPATIKTPAAYLTAAGVTLETAALGDLAAEIRAPALVHSTPDAEAVATAGAAGTVTRVTRRLGDEVRAGDVLAVVSSRDAAAMAADRTIADAKVEQARRAAEREGRLNAQGVSPRQDLEAAQAALTAAEAEARRARTAAATAGVSGMGVVQIKSPITGRITAEGPGLGAFVQTDTAVFRIADPRRVQVEAQVSAVEAERVRPGDLAVLLSSSGARSQGQVRSVTPSLDLQTRMATVVVVPAGPASLTPGSAAQAIITPKAGGTPQIVVADEAVQRIEGRDTVFVRTPDGFVVRPVTVGERSGGRASILSGLKPGEVIAAHKAFLLKAELGKGGEDAE
ncbi:MAG: efflux RND transporter periplasmic adaptor subunit [Caulobacteraceae bacterium]